MVSFLKKEEINTTRLYNLDLFKALTIVCMIFSHSMMILARHRVGYENDIIYFFSNVILANYIFSGHVYVFSMGVGIVFTKKNAPADYIKRGVTLFLLGYVLMFFSFHIYMLIEAVIIGEYKRQMFLKFLTPDFFEFAGLAMILTGIFKKLKLKVIHIFIISVIMSVVGSFFVSIDTKNDVLNLLLGHFITTTQDTSCFPLLNWYIFIAFGMCFAMIFRRIENNDLFYKRLLVISGIASLIYIAFTFKFGVLFLTKFRLYYSVGTIDAVGLTCIDLFALSIFYFMIKRIGVSKLRIATEMSRNLTVIYFFHWCVIGFTDEIFGYIIGYKFPNTVIFFFSLLLIFVSFYFARFWNKFKSRKSI